MSKLLLLLVLCILSNALRAQDFPIIKSYTWESVDSILATQDLKQLYANKELVPEYVKQIGVALIYFPELKDVKIKVKFRKQKPALKVSPTFGSWYKKNKTFTLSISNNTVKELTPILLPNASLNAQIGVLGHELSHIADLYRNNIWKSIRIGVQHLSNKKMDYFENNTDKICIDHGLGWQLLDWSTFVTSTLNIPRWGGADHVKASLQNKLKRDRYMNPKTIRKYINESSLYKLSAK